MLQSFHGHRVELADVAARTATDAKLLINLVQLFQLTCNRFDRTGRDARPATGASLGVNGKADDLAADSGGAFLLLDVRPVQAFGEGHRPGAVNVPVAGSSFGTKAAFVLGEGPLVLEATDEAEAQRAAQALRAVGLLDLAGWRPGGGEERLEPIGLEEAARLLASGEAEVVDVREADEREGSALPGTRHVPYRLARTAAAEGGFDGRLVVTVCETGPRAAVAASVLQAAGVEARPVLDGGVAGWPRSDPA